MRNLLLLLSFFFLVAGCVDDEVNWLEEDKLLIEDYLAENNIVADMTPEGVYHVIQEEGDGNYPSVLNTVRVHYTGRYLDGTKFDSSYDRGQPSEFPLSSVIPGWRIGMQEMREDGKSTFYIPSPLAYGSNPPPGIRANAIMVFEVDLLDIK